MTKLRFSILFSIVAAFLSTTFLYSIYVHNAIAQESAGSAASVDHVEEIVRLIIFEHILATDFFDKEDTKEEEESDDLVLDQTEIFQDTDLEPEIKLIEVEKNISDTGVVHRKKTLKELPHKIHTSSNDARVDYGRSEFTLDDTLSKLALKRSEDMFERGYFSHTAPDGCGIECNFESSEYNTFVWGENIARYKPYSTTTEDAVAEIFIEKWLKSSTHRDNLLSNRFTHHGVGASVVDDEIIVTVIFAAPE